MLIPVILVVVFLIGVGSNIFMSADNPIEQSAERIIYTETGWDVDLTPEVFPIED